MAYASVTAKNQILLISCQVRCFCPYLSPTRDGLPDKHFQTCTERKIKYRWFEFQESSAVRELRRRQYRCYYPISILNKLPCDECSDQYSLKMEAGKGLSIAFHKDSLLSC